ncbi:MAG: SRPBCC domain-containing protein [Bacteroidetes bacterium]|nr:SRPBCC domain-containing protein [Bacteroidota bacterium]
MRIVNDAEIGVQDREFVMTRLFNAPKELVFKVWTEPEYITKWWGPKPFTCPRAEVDLRVGGEYLYTMRSPEGQEFPAYQGKFIEIIQNEKIVYSIDAFRQADTWKARIGHRVGPEVDFSTLQSFVTVKFEDAGDKSTRLTLTQRFFNNDVRDAIVESGAVEGWTMMLQNLADELTKA